LFATVAAAPFPFGSVDPVVIAFWCVILGTSLAVSSTRGLSRPHFALLGIAGLIVVAYGLVLHEQISDHPWFGVPPHPIWQQTSNLLNETVSPAVAIAHNQPMLALGAPLAAILAMVCGTIVGSSRHRARQLLGVVGWSGAFYAALAIILFVADPTALLWREKFAYLGSLTGTFINRNTAAVYFGSCGTVCLVLFLNLIRSIPAVGTLQDCVTFVLFDRPLLRRLVIAGARFLLCFAALLMTGSRAGVVFSLVGMIVAFGGLFWRHLGRAGSLVAAMSTAAVVAIVVLQTVGSGVGDRFNQSGLGDPARLDTYRSTLRLIADHPWLGTGLGTFPASFPAYRSDDVAIWGIWDRAHNSLLEIAAEGGLPLAGLVAAAWILILAILFNGLRTRRRDLIVPVSAFSGAIIALLHSSIDFSLQIPGYAIVTFALVGAGLAQSFGTGSRRRERLISIDNQEVAHEASGV
jgi:O-antigen ligase